MAQPLKRHRFTVGDYHRMDKAGILMEDDRVELIAGEILDMSPIGGPHIIAVDRLTETFVLGLHGRAITQIQNPIRLSEYDEPQPDLSLVLPNGLLPSPAQGRAAGRGGGPDLAPLRSTREDAALRPGRHP